MLKANTTMSEAPVKVTDGCLGGQFPSVLFLCMYEVA